MDNLFGECIQLYVDNVLYYKQKTKTQLYAENGRQRLFEALCPEGQNS